MEKLRKQQDILNIVIKNFDQLLNNDNIHLHSENVEEQILSAPDISQNQETLHPAFASRSNAVVKNNNHEKSYVFVSKEGENFNITIGKRIKICRKFRAMTGNQLGRAIGLNKAFGTRITQYETNARIPRPEI